MNVSFGVNVRLVESKTIVTSLASDRANSAPFFEVGDVVEPLFRNE